MRSQTRTQKMAGAWTAQGLAAEARKQAARSRDYWRAVRTLNRWYGAVERLQDAGVAEDAPAMRRALYHRMLAQRSYEAVTD